MVDTRQTRRGLIKSGVGGAVALAVAQAGILGAPAAARADSENVLPGEIRLFGGNFAPQGWELAPGLAGRALMGSGSAPSGPDRQPGQRGDGAAERDRDHEASTLGLTYLVARDRDALDPFIGEIRSFAFYNAVPGWIPCDARRLPIDRHSALFTILGLDFGGSPGARTFAVPDLRDRTPLAAGDGSGVPATPFASERENLALAGGGRHARLHLNSCIAERGQIPRRPGQ
jgi:microcystin-dependent protein